MDYMVCDKCGSELSTKNINTTSFRCPDCFEWISLDEENYVSAFYPSNEPRYLDDDYDNYGYND